MSISFAQQLIQPHHIAFGVNLRLVIQLTDIKYLYEQE